VIVLTCLIGFIGILYISTLPGLMLCSYTLSDIQWSLNITVAPFLVIIILGLLTRTEFLREKIVKRMAYLYVAALASSYFPYPYGISPVLIERIMGDRWTHPPTVFESCWPDFFAPKREVAELAITGGVGVPWGDLMPTILFWWIQSVLFTFFMVSIANIFRRRWIDVERVPFPIIVSAHSIMVNISPGKATGGRKRYFLIGIILGVVLQIPIALTALFPWFPDIYSWRVNTCGIGIQYVTPGEPLAAIVGYATIMKTPVSAVVAYIIPVGVTFSVLIMYLIFVIAAQVAHALGFYTGIENISGCGRGWCTPSPMSDPPIIGKSLAAGGLVMLTIFYLLVNWRYIVETIRVALGRPSLDRAREIERNEPIPYRMSYLMLVTSFILITIMFMACGVSFLVAFLIPISAFIFHFANARMWGLTGLYARGDIYGLVFPYLLWPRIPTPLTRDFAIGQIFMRLPGGDHPMFGWGGSLYSTLGGYYVANLMNISSRSIFKVVMVSLILAPLITIVSRFWFAYTFGFSKLGPYGTPWSLINHYVTGYYEGALGKEPWYINVVIGMIAVAFLTFMHARFLWFPINPIGFILGFGLTGYLMGYWFPLLIAWILKTLTLRIGGSKAYEDYGLPIASGAIAGIMLAILIGGAIGVVRFFIPF
jgi:hypothetical protein